MAAQTSRDVLGHIRLILNKQTRGRKITDSEPAVNVPEEDKGLQPEHGASKSKYTYLQHACTHTHIYTHAHALFLSYPLKANTAAHYHIQQAHLPLYSLADKRYAYI